MWSFGNLCDKIHPFRRRLHVLFCVAVGELISSVVNIVLTDSDIIGWNGCVGSINSVTACLVHCFWSKEWAFSFELQCNNIFVCTKNTIGGKALMPAKEGFVVGSRVICTAINLENNASALYGSETWVWIGIDMREVIHWVSVLWWSLFLCYQVVGVAEFVWSVLKVLMTSLVVQFGADVGNVEMVRHICSGNSFFLGLLLLTSCSCWISRSRGAVVAWICGLSLRHLLVCFHICFFANLHNIFLFGCHPYFWGILNIATDDYWSHMPHRKYQWIFMLQRQFYKWIYLWLHWWCPSLIFLR